MKLGTWCPLPHSIIPEPRMERAVQDLQTPGGMAHPDPSYQFALEILQKAERYGFDFSLAAERLKGPDLEAWLIFTAIAAVTTKIELMVAVHPGIYTPQVVAKMGATLDRISGGRFSINLVNGWWEEEFNLFSNGAWLEDKEKRYQRMEEFVRVMKGLWTEERFRFDGEFYHVDNESLATKPYQQPHPPIYAASSSERGREIIAEHGNVYFIGHPGGFRNFPQNFAFIADAVREMKQRSAKYGRQLGYGFSSQVIIAPTQSEAEAIASDIETRYIDKKGGPGAIAARQMGAGLVGTPDLIAERILQYESIGIDCLMFKFHPVAESLDLFGREVMPAIRQSTVR